MCVSGTQETLVNRLSRRDFFKATAVAIAGSMIPAGAAYAEQPETHDLPSGLGRPYQRAVDLTHVITPDFPTFFGSSNLDLETLFEFEVDGLNMFRWNLVEHTGTHMDAPIHFSVDGLTVDEIPLSQLIVPLVVVDIRAKAEANPDAQLTPEDLTEWERRNGRIPENACVAMLSGWGDKVDTLEFRNADADGILHFPGFHVEAADFLLSERQASGIAVDTLSLDYGPSPDFATHYTWLPTNRWGLEAVANLDLLPSRGATLVVGAPMIAGATGATCRLLALVPAGPN